jgi:ATP-dependent helicase/nuclease subunit B
MSKIITVPFTENFLPHVVDYIYRHYTERDKDLSRLCLVFGGRRPALFIKRDLARRIKRAFVPPRFFTIDEWMAYVAYGTQVPSQGSDLDHCYTIYQLAMDLCPWVCRGRETFAQFLPWAREILHFIEQLDLEDVPLDSLNHLKEAAQIGFSVPEDINKLLMHLSTLRQAYHQELDRRQLAPRGYQYVQASCRAGDCDLSSFDEILFCNFFYLHRTENMVIKHIYDRGQAVLIMQGDQRRWPALSRIAKTFGTPILEGKEVKPTAFNLKIYEAFDSHAQAGLIKGILEGIDINDRESTVIVLPDGDFLSVLLTAVGSQLEEFNISMGYPLKRSALYALLTLCMEAQRRRKGDLYYTKDYLRLLQHPLVKNLVFEKDQGMVRVLAAKIEEALKGEVLTETSGRLFLDPEDIVRDEKLLDAAIRSLSAMDMTVTSSELKKTARSIHQVFLGNFGKIRSALDLASALQGFVEFMQTHSTMDKYPFNAQIAGRMQEMGDELKDCTFAAEIFGPRDLFKVLEERLSSQMVAFSGSPLRGLQILGLFETRALNFKNVIAVDVNEGLLPSLNIYEPLIPREVMIKLDLDRLELEEEIQRYGFMRLISAAQHVHLIYQQDRDRTRSRFIEELIWEKEERANSIGAVGIVRGAFEVSVDKKPRVIPKTPAMVEFLKSFKYSASSINAYLQNPYLFYCRYVLGLKVKDDLLEDPESRHIGIFIHDLLQEAFGGFIGKKPVLDEHFRKYFQKIYESKFAAFLGKSGRSDTFLMETVLKTRLGRFLDQEALRCEKDVRQVLYVERKFEDIISLGEKQVSLTYRVDRVDEMMDGGIFILDYKTGSMDSSPRSIPADASLTREYIRDHVRSFQMPLYVHYLRKQFPGREVNSVLYHLRTMSIERLLKDDQMKDVDKVLEGYFKALDFIMAEIYNPEIPFIDDPVDIK